MSETITPLVEGLLNQEMSPESYGSLELYRNHVLEQYKLAVDMANQISERRDRTNTFFLTLNTIVVVAIGSGFNNISNITPKWILILPLVAVLAMCYTWGRLIYSYRQLNTGKYKVIGEFERMLPTSPFWSAEWKILGEGKKPKLYLPLTHVEIWIPMLFALLYLSIGIIAVFFYK
jgi:hypothetical protein